MKTPGHNYWKVILIPFSWIYGLVVLIRNELYDRGIFASSNFHIPLISVGNITVGGTGKTPHVEYLAELLGNEFRVATLSRGYKRKTRDFRMASSDSPVREVGDEPMQLKQRFPELTVAVDRNRVNGVKQLMKLSPPVEVIIMDDAYQHRSVIPGFSILLIDYQRPITEDHLLPAGMLREPAANRNRSNIILVTRSPETIKPIEMREYVHNLELSMGQHLYFTTMRYGDLVPVYPGTTPRTVSWFREHVNGVLIVAGIANPHPLHHYARTIHTQVSELTFCDHHNYSRKDMARITREFNKMTRNGEAVLILTTEKDAMRLRGQPVEASMRQAFHAVRIHVHFLNDDKKEFDQQIRNYVNSNKRSSILYRS